MAEPRPFFAELRPFFTEPRPFVRRAWMYVGALVTVLAFPLHRVLTLVASQIGLPRTLALAAVLLAGLGAVAAVLAWLHGLLAGGPAAGRLRRAAGAGYFALAVASATAVGLAVYFQHPRLAPPRIQLMAAAVDVLLVVRFLTLGPEARALLVGLFLGAGRIAAAVPLLAMPWILHAAWTTRAGCAASPPPPKAPVVRSDAPARIVLVSFDALRGRSVDLRGPGGATPAFAEIAREATAFTNCRAAGDRTQISVPTMLSGVRPWEFIPGLGNRSGHIRQGDLHGLAAHLAPAGYAARYVTMLVNPGMFGMAGEFAAGHRYPEFLQDNDFNTRAFVPLTALWRWAADRYRDDQDHTAGYHNRLVATRDLFTRGRRALAGSPGRTFLWLHVGVPHLPYFDVPPAELGGELHPPRHYEIVTNGSIDRADAAAMRRYEAIYERYVAFVDAELARFVHGAKTDGTWDDTLFVFTGDHGERFVVGKAVHGDGAVDEDVTKVPLLIKAPRQRRAVASDELVATEDVFPTVLAAVYGAPPRGLPGRALRPTPGAQGPARTVYTWARYEHHVEGGPAGAIAAYRGPYKYVLDHAAGKEALHDLRRDPRAAVDVQDQAPEAFRALRAEVARELAGR